MHLTGTTSCHYKVVIFTLSSYAVNLLAVLLHAQFLGTFMTGPSMPCILSLLVYSLFTYNVAVPTQCYSRVTLNSDVYIASIYILIVHRV
jgi:hypothetical protein